MISCFEKAGPAMSQHHGKVVWFNNARRFGFLSHEGGTDTFCHYSAIQSEGYKSLKEGQPVDFDVIIGDSGKPQASDVRLTGGAHS